MPELSKQRLIELAEAKLADAQFLLAHGRAENAYYLAGYAVELLLKARLSSRFQADTIPDPGWLREKNIFTHDLKQLLKVALLEGDLKHWCDAHSQFEARWNIVFEWAESSRYYAHDQRDAEALIDAIDDPQHGVFQWLKSKL